jgi:hypothetical protein
MTLGPSYSSESHTRATVSPGIEVAKRHRYQSVASIVVSHPTCGGAPLA